MLTEQLQEKKKDIKELQAKIVQLQEDVKKAKSEGGADVSLVVLAMKMTNVLIVLMFIITYILIFYLVIGSFDIIASAS